MNTLIRVLFAFCLLAAAFFAAVVVVVVGGTSYVALLAAFACLVAGFAGFRIARRPDAPRLPLQMTVAVSSCIAIVMLKALAWPPSGPDRAAWLVMVGTVVLAVASLLVHRRNVGLAVILLGVPALNSGRMLVELAQRFQASGGAAALGPSATYALVVAATMGVGLLVAPWQAWAAGRAVESATPTP